MTQISLINRTLNTKSNSMSIKSTTCTIRKSKFKFHWQIQESTRHRRLDRISNESISRIREEESII